MKICVAVETGGHLTEALFLLDAFKNHDFFIISNDSPRTRALPYRKTLVPASTGKLWLLKYLLTFPVIFNILRKERPDIVLSTGAEIAIPAFYFGKLLGTRNVFLESVTRINAPTITGKAVYPVSDLFLVQHEKLLSLFGRKARYAGSII